MLGPEGGRRLSWIALNYLRDGDPRWLALGRRAVSRLNETAAPHKDGAWIHPGLTTTPPDDACIDATHLSPNPAVIAEMKKADPQKVCRGWNATWMSWTLIGLCDFYRASGDAAALTLAGRFARYLKDYAGVLSPDGRFLAGHPHPWPVVHFHHSYNTAQSILDYGIVSKDREYIDFARRVYEHMLTFCSREIGFAPEYCYGQYPRKQSFDNTEACCSADLIMMAMSLTEAGAGDYWDDIDRYIRNHIATLQLTDTRWFYNIPENRNKGWRYPNPDVEQAVGRLTGNFGGWAGVNEWHIPEVGGGIMTCCLGNATRAFYYVHNRIVDFDDGTLRVNLLLNRASRWADINSYVPYQGRVDIQLKQAIKHIRVRVPEWIKTASNDLKCTVDGQERKVNWQGRYVDVGSGSPGQAIVVTFPIGLRKVKTEIGRRPYTLTIKGNTVVAVDPPGKRIPLYQRDKYLGGDAPIVRVRRYVPKTDVALGCEGSEHKRTPSN